MLPSNVNGKRVFKCKCGAIKPLDKEKAETYVISQKITHSVKEEVKNTNEIMKWKEENMESAIKDYHCPACGYDKAQLETRQTRRADEGMTHFIICLRCGKMIKIGS